MGEHQRRHGLDGRVVNIYERAGRLLADLDIEAEAHRQTLALLKELKSGRLSLDDVEVGDLTWKIKREDA